MKHKVLMVVPMRYHDGDFDPLAQQCFNVAVAYGKKHGAYELEANTWQGMSISQNTFRLVQSFLSDPKYKDYTHLLRTDDDITYPPDAVEKMLAADKPVISGLITWKTPPYWPNCNVVNDKGRRVKIRIERYMLDDEKVVEVDGAGTGFLLVRREVLEDVWNLWSEYQEAFKKLMPKKFHEWKPVPFFPVLYDETKDIFVSTDFAFSRAVRIAGHDIFMHCGVVTGHIWKKNISITDHLNWRDVFGVSAEEQVFPCHGVKPVHFKVVGRGMELVEHE